MFIEGSNDIATLPMRAARPKYRKAVTTSEAGNTFNGEMGKSFFSRISLMLRFNNLQQLTTSIHASFEYSSQFVPVDDPLLQLFARPKHITKIDSCERRLAGEDTHIQ
jgi:hypothetical protein